MLICMHIGLIRVLRGAITPCVGGRHLDLAFGGQIASIGSDLSGSKWILLVLVLERVIVHSFCAQVCLHTCKG